MDWLEVRVITDGEGAEAVAEKLRPFAYQEGVVLEQLGDMTTAAPDVLEKVITVKIYIPEEDETPQLRRRLEEIIYFLGRLYPLPPPSFHKVKEEDWASAWKAHYHPFRVGRHIWIQPSWLDEIEAAPPARSGTAPDVILTLDPGMAFGTGLHPTTQMCLGALENILKAGMSVLDVGTGSGILGIAAAKMGAGEIYGVDIDEVAVRTAKANAALNEVTNFQIEQGSLAVGVPARSWDLVLVNILAPVIVNFLAKDNLLDYVAPAGNLILSGIIDEQVVEVLAAVSAADGLIRERLVFGDWVTLLVEPK